MLTALTDARVLTPDELIERGTVLIDDAGIVKVGPSFSLPPGAQVTRLPNLTLAPGFIDLHVHGGGGFALATTDPEEIRSYARWVVAKGVTSFLATVCAANQEEALGFLRAGARAADQDSDGASLLGLNLEGPFVSPFRRGALLESWPLPPDMRAFDGLVEAAGGHLRVMTLAPELPRAESVLRVAVSREVAVAVGHTDARYEEATRAFGAGASLLTHAFNAMRPFHHRDPGPVGAAVDSPGTVVELIADGVHLHAATVGLLVRSLGPQRVALVTDGVTPAGMASGGFRVGGQEALLRDGRVVLADGTIAGSAATMDQVVRNLVRWGIADLAAAARMASSVPAAVLGLENRKGRIAPGYDADLVALDEELEVVMTWVGGQMRHLWPQGWQG